MGLRDGSGSMALSRRRSGRVLPRIRCDFNATGWSGEEGDECYYSFDEKELARHRPRAGMRVFIYENSRDDLVMGCEAELERYRNVITNELCWRLRPIANTGFLGQLN